MKSEEQFEVFKDYADKLYGLWIDDYKSFIKITNEEIVEYFKSKNINFFEVLQFLDDNKKDLLIWYYLNNIPIRNGLKYWYEDYINDSKRMATR